MSSTVTAFQRIAVIHWSRARKAAWIIADDPGMWTDATLIAWSDEQLTDRILDRIGNRPARAGVVR